MYKVLDEDTIKNEILPHLSKAKRGFETKSKLEEVINAILYKLKTGCQWAYLPVESLFSKDVLSWQSVYHHFRKWCKNNDWQDCWIQLLSRHKSELNFSSGDIDGSHTPALRGGQAVAYQGRKKKKTTNAIFLTDRQGLPLAMSIPMSGNHHDCYQIEKSMDTILSVIERAGIRIDGLFINADSGFDCKRLRDYLYCKDIHANIDFNSRNGEIDDDAFLDEELYKQRYSIERTNAWIDSFRSLLNRFDTTIASWLNLNYISFMVIFLKKIKKRKDKV
jgi:transposase